MVFIVCIVWIVWIACIVCRVCIVYIVSIGCLVAIFRSTHSFFNKAVSQSVTQSVNDMHRL